MNTITDLNNEFFYENYYNIIYIRHHFRSYSYNKYM